MKQAQLTMPFEWAMHIGKVEHSIALAKQYCSKGAICAYSGGKDSDVINRILELARVPFERVYHVTTVDPPEVVRHVRERRAFMDHPGTNFYRETARRGLPTRWRRWCCRLFKHGRTFGDVTVLGVRAVESLRRRESWSEVETTNRGIFLCLILEWSDLDVWQFLESERVKTCELYCEGFNRLGCVGCCLSRGSRKRDFKRWPSIGAAIRRSYFQYAPENQAWWDDWINDRHGENSGQEQNDCDQYLDLWEGGAA